MMICTKSVPFKIHLPDEANTVKGAQHKKIHCQLKGLWLTDMGLTGFNNQCSNV